jgi:hypothetical protein
MGGGTATIPYSVVFLKIRPSLWYWATDTIEVFIKLNALQVFLMDMALNFKRMTKAVLFTFLPVFAYFCRP